MTDKEKLAKLRKDKARFDNKRRSKKNMFDIEELEPKEETKKEKEINMKVKLEKQYTVGYHKVIMGVEADIEDYEEARDWLNNELIGEATDLPLDLLNDLSAKAKQEDNKKPASNYFENKAGNKTYSKKQNYTQGGYNSNEPSPKQMAIINKNNLTDNGRPITDKETAKRVIGEFFDNN